MEGRDLTRTLRRLIEARDDAVHDQADMIGHIAKVNKIPIPSDFHDSCAQPHDLALLVSGEHGATCQAIEKQVKIRS